MSVTIFRCAGGTVGVPNKNLTLVDRQDGGNLVVNPPREVWERSELSAMELAGWSFLIAATGRAMLEVLPQLAGGCVNYWEAGNWALNGEAEPKGLKTGRVHRRVHMHLLGRSPNARSLAWKWGEAPRWPAFSKRFEWAARFERLRPDECARVVRRSEELLRTRYGMMDGEIEKASACSRCGYPTVASGNSRLCEECAG